MADNKKVKSPHVGFKTDWVLFSEFARNAKLSVPARHLLTILITYGGVNGRIFPSKETLAADMGMSVRHIHNLLTELAKNSLIEWRREGFNGPNHYKITSELYSSSLQTQKKSASPALGTTLPDDKGTKLPANNVSNHVNESGKLQQRFDTFTGKTLIGSEQLQFANLYEQLGAVVLDGAIDEAIRRGKSDINVGYLAQIAGDIKPPAPLFVACGRGSCNDKGYVETDGGMAACKCRVEFYGG